MSKRPLANLFADAPCSLPDEEVIELLSAENVRIKRVVSTGQVSPPGRWYDQDGAEWVVVLTGSARLLFEGEDEPRLMKLGDFVSIPPHVRHRVEWTDPTVPTIWLAVHYR
jgi:cupin 2 domain-containing protein